jgi:hypothetical protein
MFALVVMTLAYSTPIKPTLPTSCAALSPHYKYTTDWEGATHGIHLKWYMTRNCRPPGYVKKPYSDLPIPTQTTNMPPSKWTEPNYGAKQQF